MVDGFSGFLSDVSWLSHRHAYEDNKVEQLEGANTVHESFPTCSKNL